MNAAKENKIIAMLVWLCITMFYCYQYILRPLPDVIMPYILSKYGVGAAEYGSFAGIYYVGYVGVHIPIGILLSRFGARYVLPVCVAFAAFGLVPIIYFDSWFSVIVGRFLTGAGSAASIIGALHIFRTLYPTKFSMVLGIMVSLGLLSAVYASALVSELIESLGIDSTLNILLYSGIALTILTYFLLPKSSIEESHDSIWGDVRSIICNYKLLCVSLFAGLMVGPMEGFADAWGSAFFMSVYEFNKATSNNLTSSIFLGMFIGCLTLPYIADKTRLHFGMTIFSGIVMIACFAHILGGQATANSLYYACLITGIFSAYQVIIISKIATFVPEEQSGTAGAVANMIIMSFGSVFHKSIGARLDSLWSGAEIGSVKTYSSEAFISSISIIPAGISIAVVGLCGVIMLRVVKKLFRKKDFA